MSTPASVLQNTADGLDTDLLAVAGIGLGIGVVVLVVKRGWGLIRGFSR